MSTRELAVAAVCFFAFGATSQARLVKEIGWLGKGSEPESLESFTAAAQPRLSTVGKWTYFNAWTAKTGDALFRTDGTKAGTELVYDPWRDTGNHHKGGARYPCVFGGKLFFQIWGDDSLHRGYRFCVTDPATNKTTPLLFDTGSGIAFNGAVWVSQGLKLWRTDGTVPGTRQVQLVTGVGAIALQFVFRGELWFFAYPKTTGPVKLYRTDGTVAGTKLADVPLGFNSPMVVANNRMFYHTGGRLYASDGTAAGTRQLTGAVYPHHMVAVNGGVFFSGYTTRDGRELYWSDGTAVNSWNLNLQGDSNPYGMTPMGSGVAFVAKTTHRGAEPYLFDGRSFVSHDLVKGPGDSSPASLITMGSKVLVGARNGLFAIDRSGFQKIHEVQNARYMTRATNGDIVFNGTSSPGQEPWRTDGTTSGTVQIADLETAADMTPSAHIASLVSGGDRLFFTAGSSGTNVWESTGTAAGTRRIGDWPAPFSESGMLWNGMLFAEGFAAARRVPMVFDTRTRKGRLLTFQGSALVDPEPFTMFAGDVSFIGTHWLRRKLFRTDGTTVRLVKDLGGGDHRYGGLVRFRGRLYFPGGETRPRLWSTDGTAAGTKAVAWLPAGLGDVRYLTVAGDRLFFLAADSQGFDLFSTDGTAAGTKGLGLRPVGAFTAGRYPFSVWVTSREGRWLVVLHDRVFFVANSRLNVSGGGLSGVGVWSSDGTVAGTRFLAPTRPLPHLAAAGEFVYFSTWQPPQEPRFYRTRGTPASTNYHKSVAAEGPMVAVGRRVFFIHQDQHKVWGTLYQADATTLTKVDVGAVVPNSDFAPVPLRGEQYFVGWTRDNGMELFAVPIGAYSKSVVPGCSRTRPPLLDHSAPILGAPVTVRVRNIPTNKIGFYATGFATPVWQPVGGHCQTVVDLTKPVLLAGIRPDPTGTWTLTFKLPNDRSMIGIVHPGQAVVGPTATAPFGFDWSNGLHLHIDTK